jgi:hypothetical protein
MRVIWRSGYDMPSDMLTNGNLTNGHKLDNGSSAGVHQRQGRKAVAFNVQDIFVGEILQGGGVVLVLVFFHVSASERDPKYSYCV